MGRSGKNNGVAVAVLVGSLGWLAACAAEGPPPAPAGMVSEELGRVSLALVTTVGEHTYRLRNVYIFISGPQYLQLFDNDGSQTELSASLLTGNYSASLYQQGTLERDDGAGNFVPVVASLISSYYVNFTIFNGATSTIAFQFQTDGVIVTVGAGQLRVRVAVDEIAAVCTPFAGDCAEGSWCPPTTLTGMPRGCIAGGATAAGQPCAGPFECAANTTCVDQGAGPVCAELCPSTSFDASCPSGGTCQRVTAEYGVCAPAPVEPPPSGDRPEMPMP